MKDAIALALNERAHLGGLAAMVVIAREHVYPTYVRTDKLISSLQKSGLPVHSIHLTGRKHGGKSSVALAAQFRMALCGSPRL
jgi:hypothetical protein